MFRMKDWSARIGLSLCMLGMAAHTTGGEARDLPGLPFEFSPSALLDTHQQPNNAYFDQLNAGLTAMREGDCQKALALLKEAPTDPLFSILNPGEQSQVLAATMVCAIRVDEHEAAFEAMKKLSAYDFRRELILPLLHSYALAFDDGETAARALTMLPTLPGNLLNAVALGDVWGTLHLLAALDDADGRRLAVLDVLETHQYTPPDPLADKDWLRQLHVRLLLKAGRTDEAHSLVEQIGAVAVLIEMYVNRDYAEIWDVPVFKSRTEDFEGQGREAIALQRGRVAAHPDRLRAVKDLLQTLRLAGQASEAAELGAQIDSAVETGTYTDTEDWHNWAVNEWAYALYDTGQTEQGHAVMRRAAQLGEGGRINVSQVINFATMLLFSGELEEALSVIGTLREDRTSPFGLMFANEIKACVHLLRGEREMAAPYLEYLEANKAENEGAYAVAMLCADNEEVLAARYIMRLQDPENREGALLTLQTFKRYPTALPIRRQLNERLDRIRARPDIRAAAQAVGRQESIPLYRTYWGDL